MNWNVYLKAGTRQSAIQALAAHQAVKDGLCPPQVVQMINQAVMLLPEPPVKPPAPPIPPGAVASPLPPPFFPKEIEITTNGVLTLVDGSPPAVDPTTQTTIAHLTVQVSLVPGGVTAE
jgi:hypothetical protein